jgi:hypothetical protein
MKRHRPPKGADEIDQLQWVGEQLGIPLPEYDGDDDAAFSKAYSVWRTKIFHALVARLLRGPGRPRRPSGRKPLSPSARKKREQSATLPIPVAAAFLGLSEKTIRRYFTLILVSDGRRGVRKSELLRSRKEVATT